MDLVVDSWVKIDGWRFNYRKINWREKNVGHNVLTMARKPNAAMLPVDHSKWIIKYLVDKNAVSKVLINGCLPHIVVDRRREFTMLSSCITMLK